MSQRLKLDVLGSFRLRNAQGRDLALRSRKARALLAHLALNAGARLEREQLARLLWTDADPELARTSLRQALASLRRALPREHAAALAADQTGITLDANAIECDVLDVRRLLLDSRPDALLDAIERYRGDLLDGFDARSSGFDDWLTQERRALRRELIAGIERLARLCAAAQDAAGERSALERLLTLEPANERAHRNLMQLQMRERDLTNALRQYRVCRDALRRELDVAPDPATESLHREILKRRRTQTTAPAAVEDSPQPDAVADPDVATMREAFVLAIELTGLKPEIPVADPEEARALTQRAVGTIRDTVERHGGICDRLAGERLLAVFGIDETHGNEAQRAAAAALALAAELERALQLRIGIACGQLLPADRNEVFPLSGPAVAIAIELARTAAPATVQVSDAVERALGSCRGYRTRPAGASKRNGSERVWQLEADPERAALAQTTLAGRRAEIALAAEALDRAVAGRRGRTLLVRGEPGIGKTRLIAAVREMAIERNIICHFAQVLDFGQRETQRPLATVTASLLGLAREATTGQRSWNTIEDAAARNGVERDDLMFAGELLAVPLPEPLATLAEGLDAETRRHGRSRVLGRLLGQACASGARLLIVEDVHWASAEEIARLADLAAAIVALPAVLLMSTRSDDDPCTGTWRARARGCPITTLDLVPLAEDEARELAAAFGPLEPAVIEDCLNRAAGHPLFLDQLLRAAQSGERSLPGSIRMLALAKIDRLSTRAKQAAQAASVLGLEFSRAALAELLGRPDLELEPLERAGILVAGAPDGYAFAHALLRDAVYDSVLRTARRELHRRAAEIHGHRDPALRAWHLEQAGDPRAAAACLIAARSEQAAQRSERALELAHAARRLARDAPLLNESATRIGELETLAGHTHDAISSFREAIDFAPDRLARSRPWIGLASALRIVDRYDEALDALVQAESCLGATEEPALRARIWSLRGNLHFPRGELDACLEAHEQAYRYAAQANSPVEETRALGGVGDAWYQRGRMLTARSHYTRCVSSAVDHGLAGLELAYLPMQAVTRAFCGEIEAARADCERAAGKAHRASDLRAELLAFDVAASLDLYSADYAASQKAAERTIELAKQLGARRFEIEATGLRGLALAALGNTDEGVRALSEAADTACAHATGYCAPWMLGAYAWAAGDGKMRRELLARAEQLLSGGSVSHNYLEFYRYAIEAAIAERWWDEVRRYASALESYTSAEPLAWSQLVIDRARFLADVAASPRSQELEARLASIAQRITAMKFLVLGAGILRS